MNCQRFVCGACLVGVLFADPGPSQGGQAASGSQPGAQADDKLKEQSLGVSELTEQLKSGDLLTRLEALDGLRRLGPGAAPATDVLVQALGDLRMDPDTLRRVSDDAAFVLKGIGQSAVDTIIEKIKATKSPVEYRIYALAIHNFGTDAAAAAGFLIEQLEMAEGQKILLTMHALNTLGEAALPAIPYCIKALDDESFHNQVMACDTLAALAKWQRPPDDGLKRILELLIEGPGSTRRHAATCLGAIGVVEGFDIVGALDKATEDRQAMVRDDALAALGQIGPAAVQALPHLKKLMVDPRYKNRVNAARAAWRVSTKAEDSVIVLQDLLDNSQDNLDAIDALAEMKSAALAAVPKLIVFFDSPDPDLRMQAVRAIGLIGSTDKSVRSAIRQLQNDSDPDVAIAARQAQKQLNSTAEGDIR